MHSVTELSEQAHVTAFLDKHPQAVLYYTATWCPPCKAIKPVYEELSSKYSSIGFGKIDIDDNEEAAHEAAISAVPTFLFVKDKAIIDRFSGADRSQLEAKLDALL
jgi:thioredoxin 1